MSLNRRTTGALFTKPITTTRKLAKQVTRDSSWQHEAHVASANQLAATVNTSLGGALWRSFINQHTWNNKDAFCTAGLPACWGGASLWLFSKRWSEPGSPCCPSPPEPPHGAHWCSGRNPNSETVQSVIPDLSCLPMTFICTVGIT